ncbi:MAG: DUF4173 domain-containing protein [Flavobacterium sp.]|nr:MAG: DUF4173 domain-containing protein [Flavobacterium sp.]
MKKPIDLQLVAIFGGSLLFNFLFWNEGLGLNLLLHSLFIMVVLFVDQEHRTNKKTIFIAISHLIAALLVVVNHSVLNIFGYYITLIVFVGLTHAPKIKSVFAALFAGFLQLASSPINLVKKLINAKIGNFSVKPILRPIKYIIIPIIVVVFFSIIYSIANPVFAKYGELFITNIASFVNDVFEFIFGDLSFARFLHIVLGILFTAGILLAFKETTLEKVDAEAPDDLIRKRKSKFSTSYIQELKSIFLGSLIQKKMALKTEYIIGIISFVALNLLLLTLNIIDFNTLWLGNISSFDDTYLSTQLHEGANSLIFSILMAMLVILFFFSGNLNFFSKNKTLKILAYAWIVQNTFLIFSVLIRDYHYINLSGLTHKRIGVLVFLILCIIGLFTVYIKVAKKKTLYYLLKVNGQIWYILLIVFGIINWDALIVNYNINSRKKIALDVKHLMEMSDKTLPILAKNRLLLNNYAAKTGDYDVTLTEVESAIATIDTPTTAQLPEPPVDSVKLKRELAQQRIKSFNEDLDLRIERFKDEQERLSWLSWNFRDWQTKEYFNFKKED